MTRRDKVESQERRNRLVERQTLRHRLELKNALRDPWTRRVIYRLITEGRVFDVSYTGSSDTFFNEGLRAFATPIARQILDDSPALFVQIMQEGRTILAEEAKAFALEEQERTGARRVRRPAPETPPPGD